jgi:hypothetical protein
VVLCPMPCYRTRGPTERGRSSAYLKAGLPLTLNLVRGQPTRREVEQLADDQALWQPPLRARPLPPPVAAARARQPPAGH